MINASPFIYKLMCNFWVEPFIVRAKLPSPDIINFISNGGYIREDEKVNDG